jgi:hypothetical protein
MNSSIVDLQRSFRFRIHWREDRRHRGRCRFCRLVSRCCRCIGLCWRRRVVDHSHPRFAAARGDFVGHGFQAGPRSARQCSAANSFATAALMEPPAPKTTAFLFCKMPVFMMPSTLVRRWRGASSGLLRTETLEGNGYGHLSPKEWVAWRRAGTAPWALVDDWARCAAFVPRLINERRDLHPWSERPKAWSGSYGARSPFENTHAEKPNDIKTGVTVSVEKRNAADLRPTSHPITPASTRPGSASAAWSWSSPARRCLVAMAVCIGRCQARDRWRLARPPAGHCVGVGGCSI